ncbi:sugar-binding transcriptional regulator [Sporanaerobacter acetigenes]|uniref:DNA-binding transcriptional regulator LsrR, DeoR family n=1 Tax=Sporanaerobacter acetigenes DSM 13106 TaxID=1123281 RepID=A0A1M5YQF8_9FIRM|nr:sugar-binding transcriptional regulator [Sporanaerobacter acetigenes]SHI14090.1 DNA-binding transcriptional regulator LsrR, DeoR family [Sporanaerobacter acetigenes DSM 13106]
MDKTKERKLAEIAYMYYIDEMSQNQIAKEYGISRSMVSMMLNEARTKGIVRIEIKDSELYCFDLQRKMEKIFGLKKAIIVPRLSKNEDGLITQLADGATEYLSQIIDHNMTIAVSWGRTVYEVASRIRSNGKTNIVISPLVGGIGNEMNIYHSNVIADTMSKNLGASSLGLYSPVFVATKEVRNLIFNDKSIKKVIETSERADIAIVGIGSIAASTMADIGLLEEDDIKQLLDAGVIGDISTCFFDKNGQYTENIFSDRTVALSLEQLRKIPTIVAVAGGDKKIKAIHGALKGGLMDVLVTDEVVARSILKEYEEN